MKKITKAAAAAFVAKQNFSSSNTTVRANDDEAEMFLFGNKIAHITGNLLTISNCWWQTNTTKERLNALPKVAICQKKGVWYLNGKEWDGSPYTIIL